MAPLLRLKDNSCHVEESERILKKYQKFSELIILYEKKGLHKKGKWLFLLYYLSCQGNLQYRFNWILSQSTVVRLSMSFNLLFPALDLLLRQSQKPNSPLKGHDRTVEYLQRLGECMQWIPQIHLWCNICWPLGGQHRSQAVFLSTYLQAN